MASPQVLKGAWPLKPTREVSDKEAWPNMQINQGGVALILLILNGRVWPGAEMGVA